VQLGRFAAYGVFGNVKDGFRNESCAGCCSIGARLTAPSKRAIYTGRIQPGAGQTMSINAGCGRCVEPDGQHRDGVEYLTDAGGPWIAGRSKVIPPERSGKIAPTRLESINLG
jgi:hypothetical protein